MWKELSIISICISRNEVNLICHYCYIVVLSYLSEHIILFNCAVVSVERSFCFHVYNSLYVELCLHECK